MLKGLRVAFIAASTILVAWPAFAATLVAKPDTLTAVLAAAKGGDTLVLSAGRYVTVKGLSGRVFSPPLKIDATAAEIERWTIANATGVEIKAGVVRNGCAPAAGCYNYGLRFDGGKGVKVAGGTFVGPEVAEPGLPYQRADGYGVGFIGTTDFELTDNVFVSFRTGAVLNKVHRFRVAGNRFNRMRSDGVAIGQGWVGLIEGNICDGTRILSTEHPDCIQFWSRPDAPPTSDLTIRKNIALGEMQGATGTNHTRDGVDDGGFDRIVMEDNLVIGAYPSGVALNSGRASALRNNRTLTLPKAPYIVRTFATGDVVRCGNVAEAGAGKKAQIDPPC